MKLKRYRHKEARFCALGYPYRVVTGYPLYNVVTFKVRKHIDNVVIAYSGLRKGTKVREIVELLDGLHLAVTWNGLYVYYSDKDNEKFEMVYTKDVPKEGESIRFIKPNHIGAFDSWFIISKGFETGSFIAEEVDSTFAKYNMYIVKSGEKYFLCTTE